MYQLSPKDLRAIALFHKYKDDSMDTRLKDYHYFLDTLIYLNQALVDGNVQITSWEKLSETLLMKFYFHGITLHQISLGQKLSSVYFGREINGASYIDVPSAKAVLRSKLETFLMYHHIYVNPTKDEMKQLRYYSWIYTGLLHRQSYSARTAFAQKQKQEDLQELERLKEIIENLPAFKELTAKQQQTLLRDGSAKLFSHWNTIMEETGFLKNNPFLTIYSMLSVYAHSEGLSAIQLDSAISEPSFQIEQTKLDIHHAVLLTCMLIESLSKLYPVTKLRFESLPVELRYDIGLLAMLGRATGEALDR